MKIVALAGGVGGAKLVDGLAQILTPDELTVIVNTGDDFEYLGLYICPDVDTVCYTLAGLANPETGWGRKSESFKVLDNINKLGDPAWFHIGDQDFATHIERTRLIREGFSLDQITRRFCQAWKVEHLVLPMSNQPVRTIVNTVDFGELAFQEYFVHRYYAPKIKGLRFQGIDQARPSPGLLESIEAADAVVFCPSNPWVSIAPILAVKDVELSLSKKTVVAVSPIIGGEAVKGPAAKMYLELGIKPSAMAVFRHYKNLLSGFILDSIDSAIAKEISIPTLVTQTLMISREDRRNLALEVLNLIQSISVS